MIITDTFNEEGKSKITIVLQTNGKEADFSFVMDNEYDEREDWDRKIEQAMRKFDNLFQEGHFD
jgi:hypothetical protein